MTRMDSTCHALQNDSSDMVSGLRATDVLCLLCQDPSYCSDFLNCGTHLLLQTADKARLKQMSRPDKDDLVGSLAHNIQFAILECVKLMTAPRPQADPPHGIIRTPPWDWNIETTWKWTLQTMLALKSLTSQYRPIRMETSYATGLHTLHHLMMTEAHLTIQ